MAGQPASEVPDQSQVVVVRGITLQCIGFGSATIGASPDSASAAVVGMVGASNLAIVTPSCPPIDAGLSACNQPMFVTGAEAHTQSFTGAPARFSADPWTGQISGTAMGVFRAPNIIAVQCRSGGSVPRRS